MGRRMALIVRVAIAEAGDVAVAVAITNVKVLSLPGRVDYGKYPLRVRDSTVESIESRLFLARV